jgi:hypothetical protein
MTSSLSKVQVHSVLSYVARAPVGNLCENTSNVSLTFTMALDLHGLLKNGNPPVQLLQLLRDKQPEFASVQKVSWQVKGPLILRDKHVASPPCCGKRLGIARVAASLLAAEPLCVQLARP